MPENTMTIEDQNQPSDSSPAETSSAEPSLHESLTSAWESMQEAQESSADSTDLLNTVASSREPNGRFASTKSNEDASVTQSTPIVDAPVEIPIELQRLGIRKEEAAAILKSDPIVRATLERRINEISQGTQQIVEQFREKAEIADRMTSVIEPYRQTLEQLQVAPELAVSKLLEADRSLRYGSDEQKRQALQRLAYEYRINLNQPTSQADGQPVTAQYDPLPTIEQKINELTQWQQQQAQREQERTHTETQRLQQQLNQQIQEFKLNPKNVHFDAVRDSMSRLLQANLADSLEDAYQKAIRLNPQISSQMLAEQQAEAERKRREEDSKKALEARKSASINVAQKGKTQSVQRTGTLRETLEQTASELEMI